VSLSRRRLLGLGLGATIVGGLAACSGRAVQLGVATPVRRPWTDAAADRRTFTEAVAAMRRLPARDPRHWERQAEIHAAHGRHAGWLFLPWHRAYTYFFEQICRELTGRPDFALPYWDWGGIPTEFLDPASPLYEPGRDAVTGTVPAGEFVGDRVLATALAEPSFVAFGGAPSGYGLLEQGAHNYVHGFVGGVMGTFASPHDPLFWAHHSRVDQMWAAWLARHPHPSDQPWAASELIDFYDGKGRPVALTAGDTVTLPIHYAGIAAPMTAAPAGLVTLRSYPGVVRSAGPERVVVDFPGAQQVTGAAAHVVCQLSRPGGPPSGGVLVTADDEPISPVAFFAAQGPLGFRLPLPRVGARVAFTPVGYPGRPAASTTLSVVARLDVVKSTVD
jgi:hypothetical protein